MQNTCAEREKELKATQRWMAYRGYADRILGGLGTGFALSIGCIGCTYVFSIGQEFIERTIQPTVSTTTCSVTKAVDNLPVSCASEQVLVASGVTIALMTAMGVGILTRAARDCFQQMRIREVCIQPRIDRMEGELEALKILEDRWGLKV